MSRKRKLFLALVLVVLALLIHFYGRNEARVESAYSSGFFPGFAALLRTLLGKLPFSFGDILYGLAVLWIGWKLFRLALLIKNIHDRTRVRTTIRRNLYHAFLICSTIYVIFNLFWGINYDRKGIAWQLGLDMKKYSQADLQAMNQLLLQKINHSKLALVKKNEAYPSNKELFARATRAYQKASMEFPFLVYKPQSIKPSMWGWIGNFTGFTGYYNPFTGEAQVNTLVPKFTQPYTTCHEVAHQLGYAKEMEANFVGYLAAAASADTLFHYSVYLDLFLYANRNLYYMDSVTARSYREQLLPEVRKDLELWIAFNRRHKNPVGPVVRWLYGIYLQGNRQPQGILSYDEVTAFLIAYHKKFGRI